MKIAITPEIQELLNSNAPVAFGVSGGKDSCAVALAVTEYLDSINHRGPRILIHSDLGRVEWKDSLPTCERLAAALNLELVVVQRQAGDMLDRWQQRWRNNAGRYSNLECVKLILPWSTPAMRFCTSELKVAIITSALAKRFPGQSIVSVSGIRREESPARAKASITKVQPKLSRSSIGTRGCDWHPILDWTKAEIFEYLARKQFDLHEAYRVYSSSRVSCCFCIMSSADDLRAASKCEDNHELYRAMVRLETDSTFSFQSSSWLGDVAPHLLNAEQRQYLIETKERARIREEAESRIPKHLLYVKGWPTFVPSIKEAELLAEVRNTVAQAVQIGIGYTTPEAIIAGYEELMVRRPAVVCAAAALSSRSDQPVLMSIGAK